MDNKDIIIQLVAENLELKDALSKERQFSDSWLHNNAELRKENERLEAIIAQQADSNE